MHASDQRLLLCGIVRVASKKTTSPCQTTAIILLVIGYNKSDAFATI